MIVKKTLQGFKMLGVLYLAFHGIFWKNCVECFVAKSARDLRSKTLECVEEEYVDRNLVSYQLSKPGQKRVMIES